MGDDLTVVNLGEDFEAVDLHLGGWHTCMLSNTGSVKCFGLNNFGQLGYEDSNNRYMFLF